MENLAEQRVSRFYNTVGWQTEAAITEDARLWEDLRPCAADYVRRTRLRPMTFIPERGQRLLDMASGPIQYDEYLEYSRGFEKRYCVDLSQDALREAEKKIGDHGEFLHGSFFDLSLEDDFFDCVVSLHTIYHMDKDRQEEAVRKLIRITRPGGPVIIVYSNPTPLECRLSGRAMLSGLKRRVRKQRLEGVARDDLPYFYAHPLAWWQRFEDVATVRVLPWRMLASDTQKMVVPDNAIGRKLLDLICHLEEKYPRALVKHSRYPMIVLEKR